ncbi:glycosyltransferase family protein [Pedobacter frigoris]|uniref:Glycosyltransferase family 1 protein n=1 Tax=Pedobacter frigoris TaxID=2571272 RepID=A0A4U1CAB2_9SPHI|nr:glycosyltransferase [Pedobacter frigoris]TKC02909.1 glycosyltransferase family 1 protein [Pedobacter frigoris]
MKVAYIYNINNTQDYATKTVVDGFKNAFTERKDTFRIFDLIKLKSSFWPHEKLRLITYAPDVIFTDVENVSNIPLSLLKNTKLVLSGSFYSSCSYLPKTLAVTAKTKQVLNKYSTKHNILIRSPYDESFNERFFGGYQKDLGISVMQSLHCADSAKYSAPLLNPEFDFLWVGDIGTRTTTYKAFIQPLKTTFSNYLEYNEHNMINPRTIESKGYYSRSFITPNIHTEIEIKNRMLLNEMVFKSSMLGGFQICDNPLAGELFQEDELIITTNGDDFLEKAHHYISHPDKRMEMIKKMQENILKNHTYSNRIDQILASYS